MVRINASSWRRVLTLSSTEMKMLAKLRAMMNRAMARSAAVPNPNCCVMRFTSMAGRATCMLVSRRALGMVSTARGFRFLSNIAVISRVSGSRVSPSSRCTYQMLSIGVSNS